MSKDMLGEPLDPDAWVDELDLAKIERCEYEVVIDPTQTVEHMIAADDYTYVHHSPTTARFGSYRKVTGNVPVKAKLVTFRIGRDATRAQAFRLRQRLNLKAVCIQHLLALGAQCQRVRYRQESIWIVNADEAVLEVGYRRMIICCDLPTYRQLHLGVAGCVWNGSAWAWFLGLLSEPA